MFSPLDASWISNGHIALDPKYAVFPTCNPDDDIESKAAYHVSYITHQNVEEFRSIYNMPKNYELIRTFNWERASNPPSECFIMYEEHLKSGIPLSLLELLVDILHF